MGELCDVADELNDLVGGEVLEASDTEPNQHLHPEGSRDEGVDREDSLVNCLVDAECNIKNARGFRSLDAVLADVSDMIGRFSCRFELFSDVAEDIVNSFLGRLKGQGCVRHCGSAQAGCALPHLEEGAQSCCSCRLVAASKASQGYDATCGRSSGGALWNCCALVRIRPI